MKMSKYSHEVKQQALAMVETDGVRKTSEIMHITKLTLYRWMKEANTNQPIDTDNVEGSYASQPVPIESPVQSLAGEWIPEPAVSPSGEPANNQKYEEELVIEKQLLCMEDNEKAARILSLEVEKAQLRSETEQLRKKCECYRNALVALIQ
jgi:transposase-like protein